MRINPEAMSLSSLEQSSSAKQLIRSVNNGSESYTQVRVQHCLLQSNLNDTGTHAHPTGNIYLD